MERKLAPRCNYPYFVHLARRRSVTLTERLAEALRGMVKRDLAAARAAVRKEGVL